MLAETLDEGTKANIGQWFWSEKLDGMRALWIPATRDLPIDSIKFANKDRKKHKLNWDGKVATGLWSRYGNVINAPGSFLDQLPEFPVDGELYLGRGRFQELMGYVKKDYPIQSEWEQVNYLLFDAPKYTQIFQPGIVNNPNYKYKFVGNEYPNGKDLVDSAFFIIRLRKLINYYQENCPKQIRVHEQEILPISDNIAKDYIIQKLLEITKAGGEGIIVKNAMAEWEPIRSKQMLKLKPLIDDEAIVAEYTDGKGRLEDMMGAIWVIWNGKKFKLSGWTDHERTHAKELFPIGTKVTFTYRELTDEGKPKEARYFRKRVME